VSVIRFGKNTSLSTGAAESPQARLEPPPQKLEWKTQLLGFFTITNIMPLTKQWN